MLEKRVASTWQTILLEESWIYCQTFIFSSSFPYVLLTMHILISSLAIHKVNTQI